MDGTIDNLYEKIDFEVPMEKVREIGTPNTETMYYCISVENMTFLQNPYMTTKTDHGTITFSYPMYGYSGKAFQIEVRSEVVEEGNKSREPIYAESTITVTQLKDAFEREALSETKEEKPKYVAIKLSKKRFAGGPWKTEDMKEACQTMYVGDGYTYNRPVSKVHEMKNDPGHVIMYFPEKTVDGNDYIIRLRKATKKEDGTFENEYREVTAMELAEMYKEDKVKMENEKKDETRYVEVLISKKQVIGEPWEDSKGNTRVNILAPNGYQFNRKQEQVKEIKDDPKHLAIYLPESDDYKVTLTKSAKKEDGTYDRKELMLSAKELATMFEDARELFRNSGAENADDVSYVQLLIDKDTVVDEWKTEDGVELVHVLAPEGFSFSRKKEQLREVKEDPEKYAVYLPDTEDYKVTLNRSIKNEDGAYVKEESKVTAKELAKMYQEKGVTKDENEEFVKIVLSKKQIVGRFYTEEGQRMVELLAPDGYTFLRKNENLKEIKGDEDHVAIYFPKEGYEITLKKSVKQENGEYADEKKKIAPADLKESYDIARQEFKRSKSR